MRQSLKLNLLVYVKGARIWHELKCIFLEKDPAAILRRLAELDVLQLIHTAFVWNKELEKLFAEVQAVLSWFELLYLEENYKKEWVFLLALLDQLSEQMAENCLLRLEWPESKRKTFLTYRQRVIGIYQLWWRKRKAKPSEVYFTLQNIPICFLLYLMAKLSSSQKRWISEYFTKWRHTKPLLTGHDLKKMGLTPGPIFKKILDTLLKARLDGEVKTYEDEKNLVAKLVK